MKAVWIAGALALCVGTAHAQVSAASQRGLERIAQAERVNHVPVPMRDGVKLDLTILFPAGDRKNLPVVLIRTPYNFEMELDAKNAALYGRLLDEGYVIALNNERGRYYSEGQFTFLAGARDDGYDVVDWLSKQAWSNGKIGTLGCSSAAEHQLALGVADHPAHAAMIAQAPGAGIGKVGPYQEQGNFFRGGAFQNVFMSWYYTYGWSLHPVLPPGLTEDQRARLTQAFTLEPKLPTVDLTKALWHLPLNDIPRSIGMLPSDLDTFLARTPGDAAWTKSNFLNEGDKIDVPALWVFSWYDISIAPNLAAFAEQQNNPGQVAIVSPMAHCNFGGERERTIIGERDVGDARFNYQQTYVDWFDHWLKGKKNSAAAAPKVRLYTMGENRWRSYESWPPAKTTYVSYYLDGAGQANTRLGDGRLTPAQPEQAAADYFTYDPRTPVPSHGGSVCCFGAAFPSGALDQSGIEMRDDVLVYTSAPLEKDLNVTGPVEVILYVSSDARDTDFTAKLIDVDAQGRAYNLDDSLMRARYREGYDKEVMMEDGKVYEIKIGPLVTSNVFKAGHRIRLQVSSSTFPQLARNLNTGGPLHLEKDPVVARNGVHHGPAHRSRIVLPIQP